MKNVTLFKCILIVVITLLSSALSAQWSLTGNSGTTPGTNFIGTTDSKELKFKTSNAERMHIGADGFVGIGTTTSINGSRFGLSVSSVFSNAGMYINSNSQTIFGVTYTTKPTYGYAINGISKGYHCLDNGNWKLNLNGADKLLVKENGDVGIGISNPTQRLDVDGGGKFAGSLTASGAISGASGSFGGLYADGYVTFDGTYPQKFTVNMESRINESLYVDGLLTGEQIHGFTNNSGPGVTGKAVYNHPTLSSMGVFGSNNSSPNAYGVVCQGSGYYTGNWFQLSDRKLKKDVQPIQNAISRIMQLKPKSYNYEIDTYTGYGLPEGKQLGFIAQEVKEVFPELTKETIHHKDPSNSEGDKIDVTMVNYIGLIPVLTSAIQEQEIKINEQNGMLKVQLERIEKLEQLLGINQDNEDKVSDIPKTSDNKIQNCIPNPTSGATEIQFNTDLKAETVVLNVIDMQGQTIVSVPIVIKGKSTETVQLGAYATGIYTIELYVDGIKCDTKKVVKIK
ncbi:MAG: tail fiber domain-containing protein [Bacteroidetes bacterium]|nr:tail fiber domain-containing protein [Bacteroidota bacterium]MBL0074177.1 tail fiber domain-containing protein [Bacteroidota bacterium]